MAQIFIKINYSLFIVVEVAAAAAAVVSTTQKVRCVDRRRKMPKLYRSIFLHVVNPKYVIKMCAMRH